MTTVSYCRCSTLAQDLDLQRAEIARWLRSNDIPPEGCAEFTDHGISGKTTDRPGWLALNAAVERGEVHTIVMYSLSRAGRRSVDLHVWVERMREAGVRLVFVKEGFDLGSPVGKLLFGVLAAVAEMERDQLAERTRDKLKARRAQGLPHGVNAKPPRPGHKGYRRFTDGEEAQIMARLEGGEPRQAVADSLGVHYRTIIKVIKRMRKRVPVPAA